MAQLTCTPQTVCCPGKHRRSAVLSCRASKTTRGSSDAIGTASTNSSSKGVDAIPPQQQQPKGAPQKSMQDHARDVQHRLNSLVHYLTPKQEGDAGDVLMIGISLAVFIYLAMQLYRMYYYFYLQLGVMDMMQ